MKKSMLISIIVIGLTASCVPTSESQAIPTSVTASVATLTPVISNTPLPVSSPTPTVTTESWASNQDVVSLQTVADITNRAGYWKWEQYGVDIVIYAVKAIVLGDEDLSTASAEQYAQARMAHVQAITSQEQGGFIQQFLTAIENVSRDSASPGEPFPGFQNTYAIVELIDRRYLLTRLIVERSDRTLYFQVDNKGGIEPYDPIPMPPDLEGKEATFSCPEIYDPLNFSNTGVKPGEPKLKPEEWIVRDESVVALEPDPTGVFEDNVIKMEITKSPKIGFDGGKWQLVFIPHPARRNPFDPQRPPGVPQYVRGFPVMFKGSFYLDSIQDNIGENVYELGPAVASAGEQVSAVWGNMLIRGTKEEYMRSGGNTILVQKMKVIDGVPQRIWRVVPWIHDSSVRQFHAGKNIDPQAYLQVKKWYDFVTIFDTSGTWTLSRLHNEKRYRIIGYESWPSSNDNLGAVGGNIGVYTSLSVSNIRAYYHDIQILAYGDNTVYQPLDQ